MAESKGPQSTGGGPREDPQFSPEATLKVSKIAFKVSKKPLIVEGYQQQKIRLWKDIKIFVRISTPGLPV